MNIRTMILFLIALIILSCDQQKTRKEKVKKEALSVVTVNYPLYYFASRIGGDMIKLAYVIPENVDPAYWKPSNVELEIYQSADIIFTNGADYAKWMQDVSLPSSRIFDTSVYIKDNLIHVKGASHSHGPDGEHEHESLAFTTWLDFSLAIQQATVIRDVLIKKIPEQTAVINDNFNSLKQDLESLDKAMKSIDTKNKNINFIGSHPIYQYLSKGYNLEISSVHFEPDTLPTEKEWKSLHSVLETSKRDIMLWEASPIQGILERANDLGVEITVFNPCANKPKKGDFLSVMKENIESVKKVIE